MALSAIALPAATAHADVSGADIVTYTFPGDGTQDARTSQLSATDGSFIDPFGGSHASSGTVSGAFIYAFFDGPDLDPAHPAATKLTSASLTGPDGAPVDVVA